MLICFIFQSRNADKFTVQCIPIYSIIKALGLSHIDFLSLDVEGAEMKIFDTIPWDKLSFSVSIKINDAYILLYVRTVSFTILKHLAFCFSP